MHVLLQVLYLFLQESCNCSIKLAKAIPATFHQQSESLAKPLLSSMTHQHSRVRVACLKVRGDPPLYPTLAWSCENPQEQSLSSM